MCQNTELYDKHLSLLMSIHFLRIKIYANEEFHLISINMIQALNDDETIY